MKRQTYILLTVGIGLLAFVSTAAAQEQQWLQYHSSRDSWNFLGDMNASYPQVMSDKPEGVELPDFKCEEQFFARWSTPTVAAGGLWMAFDRKSKSGPHDLLYIDLNGNGSLTDESVLEAYERDERNAKFGPVKILFDSEDGPITYHLNIKFYRSPTRASVVLWPAGWYEGDITVAGQKKHCVLFDNNSNGTFNDKSASAFDCDRIRIGKEGSQDTRFVGNYIKVDGVLYRPEIARDGACIKLTKAEDVKFGTVRLPETVTQLSANGENGLFILKSEKGIASLPVGKYHVYDWSVERIDDKGVQWALNAHQPNQTDLFDIAEGNEAKLSIGEPVIAALEVYEEKGTYSFHHTMKGRDGEIIELTRNGARPPAPKVRIKSGDGKYDRTYSFEYG